MVDGGVLPYGYVPQIEDLLVVDLVEFAQLVVEEGTHQLVDGSGWTVTGNHTQEPFQHLTQGLHQQLRVTFDQVEQTVSLH